MHRFLESGIIDIIDIIVDLSENTGIDVTPRYRNPFGLHDLERMSISSVLIVSLAFDIF